MNSANRQPTFKVLSSIFVGFFLSANPGLTQPITPANDGTNTIITPNGNQFNINGGTRSVDGNNLFHSFERFGLEPGQIANFLSDPAIRNILGRVTGGEASIIQGLIQITGGNSNLFLMNPAGIIFGAGASLNVPADFTATTATGISFNNNWFNVSGNTDYNSFNGNPSGYAFAVTQPGVILNEGNLTLSSGHNLTLLGGTVINTGELSTPEGTINIVAVEGDSLVRISQEGQLLNLEVSPLNLTTPESTITPLTLPQLLTGSKAYSATNVTVNDQGQVILTGSNTIIPEQSGVAIASGDMKGNIVLQADNDITVNETIETSESVELKAGRSININADINRTEGNGDIIIQGNFDKGNAENRAEGAANINQQDGTTLNAASGNILIELGKLGEVGDINLANINTTGEVVVNANGGNINRVSEDSLIIGANALFKTTETGGIGTETEPLRIQANNLEAISGSGGIFVDALQGLTIGGVDDNIKGLSTQNGGDIVLNVDGDLTVNEVISTQFTKNQDAGDITIITQGNFNSSQAPIISDPSFVDWENGENWENLGDGGNVTIKADGNIIASDIYSSSNQGNGGDINLDSQNGYIDTSLGGLSSSSYGDGGNINLTSNGNIIINNIDSSSIKNGGNINLESTNGYISLGGLKSYSLEGEGGKINLTANGNITTGEINSYSENGNGGDISLESTNGYIDTSLGWLTSGYRFFGRDGGNINLTAYGNIITNNIYSFSDNGNGGNITLKSTNGNIDTSLGSLISYSWLWEQETDGGKINLTANGNITTNSIDSYSYQGSGGDINLESKNGYIDTHSGDLNSSSDGGGNGGNINLNAKGIVITGNIYAGGNTQGGDIALTSRFNDVVTLGNLVRGSSKATISAFGNIDLGTITGDSINLSPDDNNLDPKDGEVQLQAHNDITIREPLNLEQVSNLEIRAGRNINIKADIDTSEGNGNIFLQANDKGAEASLRGEGTGNIIMAEGTTLNAGSGDITLQLGNFGDESNIGNIIINNLETTGNITVNALGGNILQSSPSALIQAENAIFQTNETGEMGQSENPIRLDVNYLEAVTGQGGAYFYSPQGNLNIGGANSLLRGITAFEGGDIELQVGGDLKVQEPLITNRGNITLNAEGSINTTQADISSSSYNGNAGNIMLSARGDIHTGSISSSYYSENSDTGDAGNIKIESTTGSINTTQGNISSSSNSYNSTAGNITLSAGDDIQTGYISSSIYGAGDAGNIKIESTAGSINTTQGDISSSSSTGNAGNITLLASGDIQTSNIHSSSAFLGNAGNIQIESTAGSINTTQGDISSLQGDITSSSLSYDGATGNITLSAEGDIQTGFINSSIYTTGDAGNIKIESTAGSINTTQGDISSSSSGGNAGNITLSASGDIQTGSISSFSDGTGDAGNIKIESTAGSIDTTQGDIISAYNGNAQNITLSARGDIQTGSISYLSSDGTGDAGNIKIESTAGSIDTTQGDITSSSWSGNAGDIILSAKNNIITANIYSLISQNSDFNVDDSQGNAGNIILESRDGSIDTTSGYIFSSSPNGNSGSISLSALGDIRTGKIDVLSAFNITFEPNPNPEIPTPPVMVIDFDHPISRTSGLAGDISISSTNGSINTTGGAINSQSPDGSGNIILNANGDITTGLMTAAALNSSKATTGGDVTINSDAGNINITQNLETFSEKGTAGNVNLNTSGGNITTQEILSNGDQQGGNITIGSSDTNAINLQGSLTTLSENGIAGDVNLTANNGITINSINSTGLQQGGNLEIISKNGNIDATGGNLETLSTQGTAGNVILSTSGNITTQAIESNGYEQGGNITIGNGDTNAINLQGSLTTLSEKGIAGDVNLTANEGITVNGIHSEGLQQGGNIEIFAENGNIDATRNNLETFSEEGIAGNVTLNAIGSVNTSNITSFGSTESGDVTITSGSIITGNITTQSDNGPSGNIFLNSIALQGNIESANLSSIGNTQSGDITIKAEDGSIQTENIGSQSEAGDSGNVNVNGGDDVTTDNITTQGETGSGDVNVNSQEGSATTEDVTSSSNNGNSGNINVDAANDIKTDNITTQGEAGSGDININSQQGSATTADVTSISNSGDSGNVNIQASEEINLGNVQTLAGENSGNINIDSTNGGVNAGNIESIAETGSSGNIDINAQNNIEVGKIITNGAISSGSVNLNSEAGEINHQGIQIGNNLPNSSIDSINNTPASVLTQPAQNFPDNSSNSANNTSTTQIPENSTLVSTENSTLVSTENSTLVSAENSTLVSNSFHENFDLAQQNLQLNSYSSFITEMNAAFLEVEQNRTQEFKTYLGEGFSNLLVTTASVRNVLKTIQEQTGNHSAVVYVSVKPQQIELIVFDATGQPHLQTVPVSQDELLKVKREFMETITSPRFRESDAYLAPAQKLYQWLIQPIEAHLKEAKIDTLLLSMDSGLRGLPIAALHDGKQFLVEKYSLSLIPSISLMDTQYRSVEDAPVLGMGASEFIDEQALPAVPLELAIITEKLRKGQSFLNEEFTKNNLIKQRQTYPYRIVHLATHTEFLPGSLEHSYIQLWQDEKLYFNQFRQLKLNNPPVDLLVLSSCRTAIGNEQAELGFAGLAVQTGVKSVLASLWYVNDQGTLGLMSEFYTHLNQSPIKAEALRQAQISMIQGQANIELEALQGSSIQVDEKSPIQLPDMNRDFSHPYYWSGFTMVGSPW
ncbi:CHAT domain-containing protein [Planktothrix sp. FACHB-1365]|uniref:CHAT domain-containing protein n=1 Tax=Planktothrix sp. FACHB-1365 TaxID=2692855 RepID=UPI001681CCA8|nr:CHAT domain-containing protein [Planktothrix sp. FACHB-1365]MBD2482809.1 CHAT domain-containing protein [Planktothrix sp. FACHB-1365]